MNMNSVTNTKTMNSKTTILSTLQRELTTTLTKLTTARARIRFHETTQQRALEVMHTKHLEHVQRIKSTYHTTQRHFKAKLVKAHKEQTTAVLEKEQWQQQATALQTSLTDVEKNSANCVEVDGVTVLIDNFSESFSCAAPTVENVPALWLTVPHPSQLLGRHHCSFMYMRAGGILSQNITQHQEFRDYVRGYYARASFPHSTTVHRLAEVVHELQREERVQRIARRKVQYKGGVCIGIQLDMWTNTDTHTSYGCISMSEVEEPTPGMHDPQLWLSMEILAFSVFPYNSKTGESEHQGVAHLGAG